MPRDSSRGRPALASPGSVSALPELAGSAHGLARRHKLIVEVASSFVLGKAVVLDRQQSRGNRTHRLSLQHLRPTRVDLQRDLCLSPRLVKTVRALKLELRVRRERERSAIALHGNQQLHLGLPRECIRAVEP